MDIEKLAAIVKEIKSLKERGLSKLSDNTILDVSVRVYNAEQIENHRHGSRPTLQQGKEIQPLESPISTFHNSHASPNPNSNDKELATPNQISALKKMGYSYDTSKLNKHEAWLLIKGGKKAWNQKQ